ncbi:MAG: ArnT family glycosyltransferase [Candidatus Binataceae bacterium]
MSRFALWACAAISVLAAVLTLHKLDAADICFGNEAHDGMTVQLMVERGQLLSPLPGGMEPIAKPPLFHWTSTAIHRLFGIDKVTPWSLRLAAAFYGVAGVVLTMAFAWWALGPRRAVLAGLTLVASYYYIEKARLGRVDMALTFFESLGVFCFAWWLDRAPDSSGPAAGASSRRSKILYLAAFALGLAVLSKGPIGAILPSLTILVYLAGRRRWSELRELLSPGPIALGLTIAASWYVASYLTGYVQNPRYQLSVENFGRFVGALGTMPPWFYLDRAAIQSPVVSAIAIIAVLLVLIPRLPLARQLRDASSARARMSVELLATFWAVTFIFFSIAAYKSRVYLLPLAPSAAILVAWLVDGVAEIRWGTRLRLAYALICFALIVGIYFYLPYSTAGACDGRYPAIAARKINEVVPRDKPLYLFGFYQWAYELQFHLDRDAPYIRRGFASQPGIYVLLPAERWENLARRLPPYDVVLIYTDTDPKVVVVRTRAHPPPPGSATPGSATDGAGGAQRMRLSGR